MSLAEGLFWAAMAVILYTLIGYPILSLFLASLVRWRPDKQPITPKVSIVISAYNEEAAIRQKIEQSLALDYPRDLLQIVIASDGSTDATDEIARSFSGQGVLLYRSPSHVGKTATLNRAVETTSGDVLVFSDATAVLCPTAIRDLVANFHDPTVGCVTGRVVYHYGRDFTSSGFHIYQRYVLLTRLAEGRFGSQTSVSGSIHAIRRELFRPTRPTFSHDVQNAVETVVAGKRVVYEPAAVSLECSRTNPKDEFRCRVRMGVQNWSGMPHIFMRLMSQRKWGYAFQMFSHKFGRWLLWIFLLTALVSNLLLVADSPIYAGIAAGQLLFYALGFSGIVLDRLDSGLSALSPISLFVLGHAAMAFGALKGLCGTRITGWEPVRGAMP